MEFLNLCGLFLMVQLITWSNGDSFRGSGGHGRYYKIDQRKPQKTDKRDETGYATNDELNNIANQLNNSIIAVAQTVNVLDAMLGQVSVQVQGLATGQSQTEARISTIETQQTEERQPIPLFYGHFEKVVYYSHGEIYNFDQVVTQTGSGSYSTADGKYTCGDTGYYLVSAMLSGYALGKSDKDHTYGEIFLDSVKMTTLRTATSSHNELLVSSTIIIQCNTGQTVYVKAASGGGPYYRADLGDFSVMLVKK